MNQVRAVAIPVAVFSGLVLVLGLFSRWIRATYLSTPLIALAIGAILGPQVSGAARIEDIADPFFVLNVAAALTLAVGLMGNALSLPSRYVLERRRTVAVLLGVLVPLMWGISTLLILFILGVPFLVALIAGASIAPTDPILAEAIVQGSVARQSIPGRMRNAVTAESGANDGLGFPFVWLGLTLATRPAGPALAYWALRIVLWAVVGGSALGVAFGLGAGRALRWARRRRWVTSEYFLAYTVALSLFVLSGGRLLGVDGVLLVFLAGLAFVMAYCPREHEQASEGEIQRAFEQFFMLPTFVLFGLALPWGAWLALGWRALALVVAVLALRRIPPMLSLLPLLRPDIGNVTEALFLGWFGPMGVSALFYATLVVLNGGPQQVWVIVSLVVASSVVAHGLSAGSLTRWLGMKEGRVRQEPRPAGRPGADS